MSFSLEQLAERVVALEDKDAIRQLKGRYLRACDLKLVEEVRACFLPDAVRIAYQNFPLFTHRDDFVRVFEEMACQGGVFDLHHAANAQITLNGADEAHGLWSLNFRTILLATRSVTRLAVEYDDVYRKRDGRWWIAETASRITSCLAEEIGDDGVSRYTVWGEIPPMPADVA
ncbi:nuclear transport factor 2 family protein [Sphingobium lactosutens]|uniref:nuclear transport factor 2 family protein n=1 Tax=Sphingobium lactosutens TaxID=522773 RepID=UPI0015BADD9D|nr:nuclear transport factor 2 family protein [Sphingobium lactosutens]NWK96124.1 nuclear transport factor 2 family protein [Sphingobium lactosutens]